jgi:hypothetical protein
MSDEALRELERRMCFADVEPLPTTPRLLWKKRVGEPTSSRTRSESSRSSARRT